MDRPMLPYRTFTQDRPVQVGDLARIILPDEIQVYPIELIEEDNIYISVGSGEVSRLVPDETGQERRYQVEGLNLPHKVEFIISTIEPFPLTGVEFLDLMILQQLDDASLETACQVHQDIYQLCTEDQLWINKIGLKFDPIIGRYVPEDMSAREYYYRLIWGGLVLSKLTRGRGRKPVPGQIVRPIELSFLNDYPGNDIETISLLPLDFPLDASTRSIQWPFLLLKLNERTGWRMANQQEHELYTEAIRMMYINRIQSYYDQFTFYGIKFPGQTKMTIQDRRNEPEDLRLRRRAKNCLSFKTQELVNFLYEMAVFANVQIPPEITREDIIQAIRQHEHPLHPDRNFLNSLPSYSDDQLKHFYSWLGTSKDDLCRVLETALAEQGRLFTGQRPQSLSPIPPMPRMPLQ